MYKRLISIVVENLIDKRKGLFKGNIRQIQNRNIKQQRIKKECYFHHPNNDHDDQNHDHCIDSNEWNL